jgi:hypothetical protein
MTSHMNFQFDVIMPPHNEVELGALCSWLFSAASASSSLSRPCGCSNLSKIGAIVMKFYGDPLKEQWGVLNGPFKSLAFSSAPKSSAFIG